MAKKSKLNLINDDLTWSADRRYKVNSVASLNGEDYQNITGKNSSPDLLIDWQKSESITVDQTIIDGSTNAVSGNAVFDGLAGKADDNAVVKLTGDQFITGQKTFSNNTSTGFGILLNNTSTGRGIHINNSSTGSGIVSNQTVTGTGLNFLGQNNGTNTFTVDKFGATTATSFIKSGGTFSQFLKADGSVDSNSYALASSTHNPVTIGTANGLSLSTQQLSLGLASSGVNGALSGTDWTTFNGKFNTPSGLAINYLPKWNGSGFGNSNIFDNGTTTSINTANFTAIDLDYQSYVSGGATITGKYNETKNTAIALGNRTVNSGGIDFLTSNGGGLLVRMTIAQTGNTLFGKTTDAGDGIIQANGNITASPAVSPNQVVIKSQLDAVAGRPYKVYTAVFTQQGTSAPTFTVLENTIGSISWARTGIGTIVATSSNLFTLNKTFINTLSGNTFFVINATTFSASDVGVNCISLTTGALTDGLNTNKNFIEIRVYP